MDPNKIIYECNKCGWQTSINALWADLRPKRCMNKKCNQSFLLHPEGLIVHKPGKAQVAAESDNNKKSKNERKQRPDTSSSEEQEGSSRKGNS